MTAPVDVLFHVQHLLGIGHLKRAALLAKAIDRAGLSTVLASGGMPVPDIDLGGARLAQLPALRTADKDFSGLVDETGRPVDEAWKAARRDHLLALFARTRPRALLIELFPFGRRQLRFELLPLLDAALASRPRPLILCSLRDVLNPSQDPKKRTWILDKVRVYLDRVLVHGDPRFLPLEASFPAALEIADLLRYTGYVAPEIPAPAAAAEGGEVLVSTGGGAVAQPLIESALAARPKTRYRDRPWRVLAGHGLPEPAFRAFVRQAPPGVTVERNRPDFPDLLSRCALSVSQGGYNTVMDVLAARRPAVIVPFASEGEREQTLRAERLAAEGLITLVPEGEDAAGDALAAAVDRAAERRAAAGGIDLRGAEQSAAIIADLLAEAP